MSDEYPILVQSLEYATMVDRRYMFKHGEQTNQSIDDLRAACLAYLEETGGDPVTKQLDQAQEEIAAVTRERDTYRRALEWLEASIKCGAPLSDTWWYGPAETVLDMIKQTLGIRKDG